MTVTREFFAKGKALYVKAHTIQHDDGRRTAIPDTAIMEATSDMLNPEHVAKDIARKLIIASGIEEEAATIDDFQDKTYAWSTETFPSASVKSRLAHMESEVREILDDPSDITEWADAFLLFMDAGKCAGHKASEIITAARAKHTINKARKWGNPNKHGFVEHIKEGGL